MNREAIRHAVAIDMAAKGYRRSWYGWDGCKLSHWTMRGTGGPLGKFPSGMSRKKLTAALAAIPHIGPPIIAPQYAKADRWRQTDIEEFCGEGRH